MQYVHYLGVTMVDDDRKQLIINNQHRLNNAVNCRCNSLTVVLEITHYHAVKSIIFNYEQPAKISATNCTSILLLAKKAATTLPWSSPFFQHAVLCTTTLGTCVHFSCITMIYRVHMIITMILPFHSLTLDFFSSGMAHIIAAAVGFVEVRA